MTKRFHLISRETETMLSRNKIIFFHDHNMVWGHVPPEPPEKKQFSKSCQKNDITQLSQRKDESTANLGHFATNLKKVAPSKTTYIFTSSQKIFFGLKEICLSGHFKNLCAWFNV